MRFFSLLAVGAAAAVWCLTGLSAAAADLQWPASVDADTFAKAVRAEISRAYKVAPEAVSLEGLPAHGQVVPVDGGADALRLRDQALRSASGRSSLPIDILERGKLKRIVNLPVRVTVWSDVVVTRGAIPRGTSMSPDLLAVERRPIQTLQRGVIARVSDVVGQSAAMDLAPHSVVLGYLLRVPTGVPSSVGAVRMGGDGVRIGTEVTVRYTGSGLSLVGKGRVLDSGEVGKDVRVRLLNFPTSKVVKARVFSAQEVRVIVEETP